MSDLNVDSAAPQREDQTTRIELEGGPAGDEARIDDTAEAAESSLAERAVATSPSTLVPDRTTPPPQMLDPRVVTLNRIIGSIVGAILGLSHLAVVIVVSLTANWPAWGLVLFAVTWFPVAGFLTWLAVKWPAIDYRHWRYRVDAEGIEIWSGVVWRTEVAVPRSRVQHIDVSQGPIERSYGLATLSIHTAGTEYSKVDLPGLAHGVALSIRDALLPKDAEPAV